MSDDKLHDINEQKEIEFYSACVNAWFNTKLEYDKSILVLSSSGIGLLLSLFTAFGIPGFYSLAFYILAIIFLGIASGAVLVVFVVNASHIEKVISGKEKENFILSMLDKVIVCSFALGVFFVSSVGVSIAINSFNKQEAKMSQQKSNRVIVGDSFNGISKLDTSATAKKSFNGVAALQPKPADTSSSSGQTNQQDTSSQSASNDKQ